MPDNNLFSKYGLPEYLEFETHPLDEDENKALKPFFIIQRNDIERAGFVDIRLAVHGLMFKLIKEGWINLKYPRSFLLKDLQKLRNCDHNRFFIKPGVVNAFAKYGHPHDSIDGRTIVEHFLDWGNASDGYRTLKEAWSSPSCLYSAIQSLLDTGKDITRSGIVRHLGISGGHRHAGPKYINPGLYYSIIKSNFSKYRTILDLKPGYGSKLLAASLMDSVYITDRDGYQEMAKFVACRLGEVDQRHDITILSDSEPLSCDEAIPLLDKYLRKSNGVLVMVKDADVAKKYKPRRIIKAQMCPNFLLKRIGYFYFLVY
jgi:hypothetical protein